MVAKHHCIIYRILGVLANFTLIYTHDVQILSSDEYILYA